MLCTFLTERKQTVCQSQVDGIQASQLEEGISRKSKEVCIIFLALSPVSRPQCILDWRSDDEIPTWRTKPGGKRVLLLRIVSKLRRKWKSKNRKRKTKTKRGSTRIYSVVYLKIYASLSQFFCRQTRLSRSEETGG